jgi:hypothetical protein
MTTEPGTTGANPDRTVPLEWTFDPWLERPVTAGIAALVVLGLWLVIAANRFPVLLGVALGALVASPLLPAFVPAACRVGEEGASRRGLLGAARRGWRDVRRIDDVPVGVLLSPYASRHWLDATRALVLPMPRPRQVELRARVRALWGAHGG